MSTASPHAVPGQRPAAELPRAHRVPALLVVVHALPAVAAHRAPPTQPGPEAARRRRPVQRGRHRQREPAGRLHLHQPEQQGRLPRVQEGPLHPRPRKPQQRAQIRAPGRRMADRRVSTGARPAARVLIRCSVQWSPHPATSSLILSTSSQKLLVWDLAAPRPLLTSFDAHSRAITDINWHALNPNLMATVSMDAGIRGWDMRCFDRPVMRLCDWGAAGTQVKWNRRHDHLIATAHGNIVHVWDDRVRWNLVTDIDLADRTGRRAPCPSPLSTRMTQRSTVSTGIASIDISS